MDKITEKKQRKKLLSYMKNLEICLILTLKLSDALRMMKDMILYLTEALFSPEAEDRCLIPDL